MNYSFITWMEYFIGSFFICLGGYSIGSILLNKKISVNLKKVFFLIGLAILTIINSLIFDNIIKVLGVLIIISCIYYFLYKEKFSRSLTLAIITYIFTLCGETTIAMFASIFMLFKIDIVIQLSKLFLVNFFVALLAICYAYLFKNIMKKFIKYIDKNNMIYTFILGLILILVLISSLYNILFANLVINYKFILNVIIIIGCIVLSISLIIEFMKKRELSTKYNLLNEYLKTSAELIEKYSTTIHKYNNNLIVLKGHMKSSINAANEYLDNLLDNYKTQKYNWFTKINYINHDTIRYLVYYKLSKAEELNLNINVLVDKKNLNLSSKNLSISESSTLLDILAEYFDNAIYASSETEDKELNFSLYNEKESIVFEIANTFNNDIDLSMITKNGYTTKGKGHGLGLYDIEKVVKRNSIFNIEYLKIDKYFIAKLYVSFKNKE